MVAKARWGLEDMRALIALLLSLLASGASGQTYGQPQLGLQQGTTTPVLVIFDGTQNVSIGQLNTVAHTWSPIVSGNLTVPSNLTVTGSTTLGTLSAGAGGFTVDATGNTTLAVGKILTVGGGGNPGTIGGYASGDGGNVLRTFNSKIGDFVSVKDFLTVGQPDGVTDNTAQIGAAASAMCSRSPQGKVLFFPAGTYVVSSVITVSCGLVWQGDGIGVTTIKYSGGVSGVQWVVPGYPAFRSNAHVQGGGIRDMTFTRTDGMTSTAITVQGFQNWTMRDMAFNNPYGTFYSSGNEHLNIEKVFVTGGVNIDWNFFGDLSGLTASGAACSTGNPDCSTRSDFIVIRDVENIDNTLTSVGFEIKGFVATVMMDHVANEGPLTPLDVECQAGLNANMGQCPAFITLDDFQAEFYHGYINISDFLDFKCIHCYWYGDATSSNSNNAYVHCANYCGSTVPVGKFMLSDSLVFSTWNDNIVMNQVYDINIWKSYISAGNVSNGGYSGLNLCSSGGVGTCPMVHVQDNTFCTVDGYAGAHPLAHPVAVNGDVVDAVVTGNSFRGCAAGVFSAVTGTLVNANNLGP